jgi:hypothetical protein
MFSTRVKSSSGAASSNNSNVSNGNSTSNVLSSPTPGNRSMPERRMTMTKITMHVVGPDDDPQHDDEETFEFDVDGADDADANANSDASAGGGANVEIQWLNSKSFNELDDIESQVARMQQDMVNATADLERMMSDSSLSQPQQQQQQQQAKATISPSSTPALTRIASPTPQQRNTA